MTHEAGTFVPASFTLERLYLYETIFSQTIDLLADFLEEGPIVGDGNQSAWVVCE